MKKTVLVLIAFLSFSRAEAQDYINIGSNKEEVRKVMGEPTSIMNYEPFDQEVWKYGDYGIASITFKEGKIIEYNNYKGILKIGSLEKDTVKKGTLHDKLSEEEKQMVKLLEGSNSNQTIIHQVPPSHAYEEDDIGMTNRVVLICLAIVSVSTVFIIIKKLPK